MNNKNNTNNNSLDDEDDLYTIVEPIESYQSSSTNCGVSTIISSRQIRPLKQLDMLLTPCSHNSSFSLCNTIMLPFITTEESIECNSKRDNNVSSTIEASNTNAKSELVHSETLKESKYKHIKLEKEKSPKNTLSLKDVKVNKEKESHKNYQNSFFLAKNLSYNNGNINTIDINININKIKKINLNNVTYNHNNDNNNNCNNNNQTNKNKKKEQIIKDNNRIEKENESFVERKLSMRVGENKNHISDMDKSDNDLKKIRKVKIKNSLLSHKNKLKTQDNKKKEDASLEKSRSLIDEKNSKKNKKIESDQRIKTSKNFNNTLQIKNEEKTNNENYKKIKKKKTIEIKDDDEDEDNDDESMKKNNKKKKIKNNKNDENKKDWKVNKFRHFGYKMKINKSFHIKPNMNIIREIIKNKIDKNKEKEKEKEKEKNNEEDSESYNDIDNDNDSDSRSDDICKEKDKNSKIEKKKDKEKEFNREFYIKKSTMNNDKRKEEDKPSTFRKRNADRQKTFTNEYFKKLRFSKKEDKKEEKREENEKIKQKIKKEKEKNKNKDKDKDKDKYDSFNISIPQKHYCTTTKNIYKFDVKNKDSPANNSQNILRKERSNSLILKKSQIDINKKKINLSSSLKEFKIKKKTNKKVIDFENALQNNINKKKMQFNLFSQDKFTNTEFSDSDYLKYTLNCMDLILDIDMEKQSRIKNKINFNFQKLKKKSIKKKIALFDLDETLVHCTGDIKTTKEKYQNIIEIKLPGRQEIKVGINVRPLWKQTLNLIKKKYQIVIYTASHQAYADAVLDFMDPKKKYFKYRLYRNNCSLLDVEGAKFYVKDLEILNEYYNLKDIVIIDNSVLSFAFHLQNGIPIVPYYDEDKDGSLYVVGLYLMHIYDEEDLREANKKHINLDSFLQEAKRKKEESLSSDGSDDRSYDTVENEDNVNINMSSTQNIPESKSDKTNNAFYYTKRFSVRENSKKFSEKRVNFNINKKKSISELSAVLQRKKSSDFTKDKLKRQSKLLTMYYELNDESTKSIAKLNLNMRKSNANAFYNYKLKEKILNNNFNSINTKINEERTDSRHPTVIFVENENENDNNEMECKTDRNYEHKNWNDFEIGKLKEIKEVPVLTRGVTIKPDLVQDGKNEVNKTKIKCKKSIEVNNKLKNQMGYIRSNFFNTFKI